MDSTTHNHTCAFIYFLNEFDCSQKYFFQSAEVTRENITILICEEPVWKPTRNSAELSKYGRYNMASTNSTASRKSMVKSRSVSEE